MKTLLIHYANSLTALTHENADLKDGRNLGDDNSKLQRFNSAQSMNNVAMAAEGNAHITTALPHCWGSLLVVLMLVVGGEIG